MGRGIIRIPADITLSPLLDEALTAHFPEYAREIYSLQPNYEVNFQKRASILQRAFLFLLEAYPFPRNYLITKDTIKEYVQQCYESYQGMQCSVSELQGELSVFTNKLIDVISLIWNEPEKDATELLNEAEQYVLMARGRPHLATVTPLALDNEVEFIIQCDEVLPPYDEQIVAELEQIKAESYPKTPLWFRQYSIPLQLYYCYYNQDIIDINKDFNNFFDTIWSAIKTDEKNLRYDLQQIADKSLPLPPWFERLAIHQQSFISFFAAQPTLDMDKYFAEFKDILSNIKYRDILQHYIKIPHWYWVLAEHQQYFLEHVLKNKQTIQDAISFLPSRHRTLPILANYAAHSLWTLNNNGELRQLYAPKTRSSHVASRDGIDLRWPKTVLRRHVDANLRLIMASTLPEQPLIIQTLITPVVPDGIPVFSSLVPDFKLEEIICEALQDFNSQDRANLPQVLHTNHPLNPIGQVMLHSTLGMKSIQEVLRLVKKYISEVPELATLVHAYEKLLTYPTSLTEKILAFPSIMCDTRRPELFLSSLEQLFFYLIKGRIHGTCVSGKDREAIILIFTDAMILYRELTGQWLEFDASVEQRNQFIDLFATLYLSRHQHEHAAQNAPGCAGIKTPYKYLPADICARIHERAHSVDYLRIDDRLATNNEVKKITIGRGVEEGSFSAKEKLLCKLVVKELGEAQCQTLYDTLFKLLNESRRFMPREPESFFIYTPTGIGLIKKLMHDPAHGANIMTRLAEIFAIVLSRPEHNVRRTAVTKSVYQCIRTILSPKDPTVSLLQLAQNAHREWTDLFMRSKKSSETSVLNLTMSLTR